jgi:hypothetical protein
MAFADNPHVERVLLAVEAISGDHDRAVAWLQEPLTRFGGKTALELIAEGRTDAVLGYLASIESGFVGCISDPRRPRDIGSAMICYRYHALGERSTGSP